MFFMIDDRRQVMSKHEWIQFWKDVMSDEK